MERETLIPVKECSIKKKHSAYHYYLVNVIFAWLGMLRNKR
jgi:hypothetical protein